MNSNQTGQINKLFPIEQNAANLSTYQLINLVLHLADNTLILSQRNGEWCGHGPILEQDIAITNITLDLLGQSRNFYQYAATLMGNGATEDSLAYFRTEREFKNCLLAELANGDWGQTILRQFFFSGYQFLLYEKLQHSKDDQLAAIAAKALKEVTYHLRWSSEWVLRLGDGTAESHARMQAALAALWPYTGELFMPAEYEQYCAADGTGVDLAEVKAAWEGKVQEVLVEANLTTATKEDAPPVYMYRGGKQGTHTEAMGFILTELQYVQRTYPGNEW
jgi:ring-1,2-phenylacetyl-CoA epoxidase subunit PaaC